MPGESDDYSSLYTAITPTPILGTEMQMQNSAGAELGTDDLIVFDTMLSGNQNVAYDSAGTFTLNQGSYLVNWWVACDGRNDASTTTLIFSIYKDGVAYSYTSAPYYSTSATVTGSSFISVTVTTSTLQLKYLSGSINLINDETQGGIVITQVG